MMKMTSLLVLQGGRTLRVSQGQGGSRALRTHSRRSTFSWTPAVAAQSFSTAPGRTSTALHPNNPTTLLHATNIDTNPPKGTRDFYPDEYRLQTWLYGVWREAARCHGFEEYDSPVVEQAALFSRKAGEEIADQLYTFADKSGRQLCLRPEMTPSLARMVLGKGKSLSLPIKWFSLPQCWRYENMSKGRRREHYQWNMDVWGVPGVEAEAEVLSAMVAALQAMGLTAEDVGIKVNSKHIIVSVLEAFGVAKEQHSAACIIIDKGDKVPLSALQEQLQSLLPGLSPATIAELLVTLQMKDIGAFKAVLGSDNDGIADMERLLSLSETYGYRDWLVFDAAVVRGLSYYTGIVFEAVDRKGDFRTICGGGRYDRLLDSFTASTSKKKATACIPAVGFGFGDAVIIEILKSKKLLPDVAKKAVVDVVVCSLVVGDGAEEEQAHLQKLAIAAATELRKHGLAVDLILENKRAKWMFQRADKLNADCTLMFAAEESGNNEVVLKDMKKGSQVVINSDHIVEEVRSLLSHSGRRRQAL